MLLYADRPIVIDSIVVAAKQLGDGSTRALSFEVTQDSTSVASSQVIAVANVTATGGGLAAGDTIILDGVNNSSGNVRKVSKTGTAGSASGATQLKYINATNTTIDNLIPTTLDDTKLPVGYFLIVDVTGTITTTDFNGFVQIRFRSRQA